MRSLSLRLWLLAILSAILQILPFPIAGPTPLWRTAFSWIALLPLLAAFSSTDRKGRPLGPIQTAILGYLCGILWYLGNCYWIYQTMYLYGGLDKPVAAGILILFCLYLGLYHALFGFLMGALRISRFGVQKTLMLSPFVWVAVELARARLTSFPWDLLGNTQINNHLLLHLAPVTGVYGISFVVAAINALWLLRVRVREGRYTRQVLTLAGVTVVVLGFIAWHYLQLPARLPASQTTVLVQENLGVGAESKDNYETTTQLFDSFARLSVNPPADRCFGIPELPSTRCIHFIGRQNIIQPDRPVSLIAWPESPAGFRTDDPAFRERLSRLAQLTHAPLVIGSLGVVPDPVAPRGVRVYNSAELVRPDGIQAGRYDKIHLVPWGEYVPYKQLFFFANRLTAGVGDMDRGSERTVFRTGGQAIGVFICYESIFGDEVRQFVQNGAEVLVNISDDGWYGDTSAPWQHLDMVRMRAVENHRWILRSTNTGVTAVIDPYGRVTASATRHIRTALRANFDYEQGMTFYTRYGDIFAYLCAFVTLVALGISLFDHRKYFALH